MMMTNESQRCTHLQDSHALHTLRRCSCKGCFPTSSGKVSSSMRFFFDWWVMGVLLSSITSSQTSYKRLGQYHFRNDHKSGHSALCAKLWHPIFPNHLPSPLPFQTI